MILRFCQGFTRLLPLWIVLSAVICLFFPEPFKPVSSYIPFLIGVIMLAMGLTMEIDDFKLVFSRPKDVLLGILLRYMIMPVVALTVSKIFNFEPALAAGFILVGSCPSAVASNVMTFISKGDTALSVTVSSCNTLLAPFITPFVFVYLAGSTVSVNANSMFIDIAKIVLLPIALGVGLRMIAKDLVSRIVPYLPFVSTVAIVITLWPGIALNASRLLNVALLAAVGVLLHNCTGLGLGFFCAKKVLGMSQKKSQAIAFEVGMENTGLSIALALTYLDPIAAIPGAIFGACHNLTGSALATYWASRAEEEDVMKANALPETTVTNSK